MLHRLALFWALPAMIVAAGTTYVVFSVDRDLGYVVSTFRFLYSLATTCFLLLT